MIAVTSQIPRASVGSEGSAVKFSVPAADFLWPENPGFLKTDGEALVKKVFGKNNLVEQQSVPVMVC